MNCDTVREQLDALADGELRPWASWHVRSHVAHCPACAEELAATTRLTGRARDWRSASAPSGLQTRVLGALPHTAPPPVAFRPRGGHAHGRRLAVSGAVALAGVGLIFGLHGHADALQQMERAVSQAHTVHMTLWWRSGPDGDGPLQKDEEVWYQDGCWRKTAAPDDGGDRIIRQEPQGLEYYRYQPSRGTVVQSRETAPQPGASGFTFSALAQDYFPIGSASRTQGMGMEEVEGRMLEEITVSTPDNSERMLFWLDPATDLPAFAEKQDRTDGQWVVQGRMQMTFNRSIPPSVFDPSTLKP